MLDQYFRAENVDVQPYKNLLLTQYMM